MGATISTISNLEVLGKTIYTPGCCNDDQTCQNTNNCNQFILFKDQNQTIDATRFFTMSAYYVKSPAYFVADAQGWQEKHRENPIVDWMKDHEQAFDFGDSKSGGLAPFLSNDFVFVRPDGYAYPGGEPSWEAIKDMYFAFTGHYHEPIQYIVWESEKGYMLAGQAYMFANFPVPLEGAEKYKDLEGRDWDFRGLGGFIFEYVKDPTGHKGIKMTKETITTDGMVCWLPI
jgi:hypothetical protein